MIRKPAGLSIQPGSLKNSAFTILGYTTGVRRIWESEMAGRYQGRHVFIKDGEHLHVEVFWQQSGWFWRPHKGRVPDDDAIGPFTTSTEAYENAKVAQRSRARHL